MTDASIETPSDFKDRTSWLIAFGVFEVLLGLLAGGFALLMLAMHFLMPQGGPGMGMAVGIYGAAAAAFIWLGIGSIMARRWARALMLTCSSLGLAMGTAGFMTVLLIFPQMNLSAAAGEQEVPAGFMTVMMAFMLGLMFCIYIALPGLFVLFYRSRHVKATCEWKDPKTRWTDKCPLPVLAVAIFLAVGAVSCLGAAVSFPIFPVPGGVVTGPVAILAFLALGALFAVLTWGLYTLRPAAWWGTVILVGAGFLYWVSLMATGRLDMLAYYEAMNIPPEQMEAIKATGSLDIIESPTMVALTIAWAFLYLGYLFYVKRFFGRTGAH